MKIFITMSLTCMCLLLDGCRTLPAGCRISVSNAGLAALAAVRVRDAAGTTYAFGAIPPNGIGPYVPAQADLQGPVTLEITAADGATATQVVNLERPVRRTFDGRVVFEVAAEHRVRVFILPATNASGERELPWNLPPAWESAPSIPGLPR